MDCDGTRERGGFFLVFQRTLQYVLVRYAENNTYKLKYWFI